jgi:hypothetical protein
MVDNHAEKRRSIQIILRMIHVILRITSASKDRAKVYLGQLS